MMQRKVARLLVAGALAAFGLVLSAGIASAQEPTPTPTPTASPEAAPQATSDPVVQGSNASTDSTAGSGDATATNSANASAGPSANGSDGGMSSQIGDNSVTVNQSSSAKSGDSVAGSQVTGVVGGGDTTIQNQNSSTGAEATSGSATAVNTANVTAGPQATAGDGGTAMTSQEGNNDVEVNQESVTETGSAVAGSQVTGIVGSGNGDAVVQGQNTCTSEEELAPCALSDSGSATSVNTAEVAAGPFSDTEDGTSMAGQIGDNDVTLTQSAWSVSGDSLAGAQVTGGVGLGGGTVQNQNSATNPEAASGTASVVNDAAILAGPRATSDSGTAMSSQTGDNTVEADQTAVAETGDAVAGGQVTGLASVERGHLTVQNQQSSETPVAVSGTAFAVNDLDVEAGPIADTEGGLAMASQGSTNEVVAIQTAEAKSGDAIAGGQVTGIVGGDDVTVQNQNTATGPVSESGGVTVVNSGDVFAGPQATSGTDGNAMATQNGDNTAELVQEVNASSGDAVAGGGIVGIVGSNDVTVQAQNTCSTDDTNCATAESGAVVAVNAGDVFAGPTASTSGTGDATTTQNGDNAAVLDQVVEAESGDAVAGGQVFGVVASGDVTIQAQNDAVGPEATSGPVVVVNSGDVAAGPVATTEDGTATATQNGDNSAALFQEVNASSGDAVAGGQVVGVVGGDDVVVQLQNTSEDAVSDSGAVVVVNDGTVDAGPFAEATGAGDASASQNGDNAIVLDQLAEATTGDAVSGSQVVGVAGADDATVQHQNNSTGDTATSSDSIAVNVASGFAGPVASPGNAVQNGDNDITAVQELLAESGDGVAGSEVIGIA